MKKLLSIIALSLAASTTFAGYILYALFINQILETIDGSSDDLMPAYLSCIGIACCALWNACFQQWAYYEGTRLGYLYRNVLNAMIIKKTLQTSNNSVKCGFLVTLMSITLSQTL